MLIMVPAAAAPKAVAAPTVSRRKFVVFFELVEAQRSGYKSKSIELLLAPKVTEDFERMYATV